LVLEDPTSEVGLQCPWRFVGEQQNRRDDGIAPDRIAATLDGKKLVDVSDFTIVRKGALDGYDEWMRNLMVKVPAIPLERLQVTCQSMNSALPTATIRGCEEHRVRSR
jgi:hypothetical protein